MAFGSIHEIPGKHVMAIMTPMNWMTPDWLKKMAEADTNIEIAEGDSKQTWDPRVASEVEAARVTFNKMTKDHAYEAYTVDSKGEPKNKVNNFDPEAGALILKPRSRGG